MTAAKNEIVFSHALTVDATIKLTEAELGALDALAGYGVESFLVTFYAKMGRAYLQPYLFKQHGEWAPSAVGDRCIDRAGRHMPNLEPGGSNGDGTVRIARLGKKVAGRMLDGRTHDGFPA